MIDGPQKGLSFSPEETKQASAPVDSKRAVDLGPVGATISDASKNRLLRAMVGPGAEISRGDKAKPYRLAQRGNNFPHPWNSFKHTDVESGDD
jgi:hypothetical protein